jgi:hypothetical protein
VVAGASAAIIPGNTEYYPPETTNREGAPQDRDGIDNAEIELENIRCAAYLKEITRASTYIKENDVLRKWDEWDIKQEEAVKIETEQRLYDKALELEGEKNYEKMIAEMIADEPALHLRVLTKMGAWEGSEST